MYVLCTLVLLSLHNLFKRPRALEPGETDKGPQQPRDEVEKSGHEQKAKPPWHDGLGSAQGGISISQSPCGCVVRHCHDMRQHRQHKESVLDNKSDVPTNSGKAQVSEGECWDSVDD